MFCSYDDRRGERLFIRILNENYQMGQTVFEIPKTEADF
jgi:hypothetical protein